MALTITPEQVPVRVDADGVARVGATRVTLDTIVAAFEDGASAEEIAEQYPAVTLADVYAVIGYYLRQREKVTEYLRQRQHQAATVRRENEQRPEARAFRERLLARRH